MSIRHVATAALLALSVTAPSMAHRSTPNPYQDLATASSEIDALEHLAQRVRDPRLRGEMLARAQNAELAVDSAKRSIATPPGVRTGQQRPGWQPAPALSYQEARSIVEREWFDSSRVQAIQRVAVTGRFTTEQAASLAGMCDFDSSKQQALIALYPAVVDPGRYELALGILDFPSSRRAVEQALRL